MNRILSRYTFGFNFRIQFLKVPILMAAQGLAGDSLGGLAHLCWALAGVLGHVRRSKRSAILTEPASGEGPMHACAAAHVMHVRGEHAMKVLPRVTPHPINSAPGVVNPKPVNFTILSGTEPLSMIFFLRH